MLADNALGWEIVLKISHLPSKLRFSAKYSVFGHYQPTYQPLEEVYLPNRSQMTSKCGENKKVAHVATAECVTDVLTTFWRLLIKDARKHGIYLLYMKKEQRMLTTSSRCLYSNRSWVKTNQTAKTICITRYHFMSYVVNLVSWPCSFSNKYQERWLWPVRYFEQAPRAHF